MTAPSTIRFPADMPARGANLADAIGRADGAAAAAVIRQLYVDGYGPAADHFVKVFLAQFVACAAAEGRLGEFLGELVPLAAGAGMLRDLAEAVRAVDRPGSTRHNR